MKKWKQYLHIQPWEKQESTPGCSISRRKRLAGFGVGIALLVGFFSINTNSFSIVGGVVGLVAFLMAAILWRGAKLKLFTYKRLKFSDILLAIAAFLLIACLDQWLFSLLGTDATANDHAIDDAIQMRSTLWLVLLGTFIGPFIEEVVYRGMGLKYMFHGFPWVGVIILSALFTYTHGPSNFIEFLIYFQSAVIYSLVYLKTKRIALPLLMHIVNNAFTFIPLLF